MKIPDRIASFSIFYPIVFSFVGIIRIWYEIRINNSKTGQNSEWAYFDRFLHFYILFEIFRIRNSVVSEFGPIIPSPTPRLLCSRLRPSPAQWHNPNLTLSTPQSPPDHPNSAVRTQPGGARAPIPSAPRRRHIPRVPRPYPFCDASNSSLASGSRAPPVSTLRRKTRW